MISLKKLIMRPGSPDRAMEQAYYESEGALARIAHVNRLSRDIMDIKLYPVDLEGGTSVTIRMNSKKGIIDVENADATATSLFFYLDNDEITQDRTKFYTQLSVYSTNSSITPIVIGRGFAPTSFLIEVKNLDAAASWDNLYVYYEIVKID
jgi:hypothetical protein